MTTDNFRRRAYLVDVLLLPCLLVMGISASQLIKADNLPTAIALFAAALLIVVCKVLLQPRSHF